MLRVGIVFFLRLLVCEQEYSDEGGSNLCVEGEEIVSVQSLVICTEQDVLTPKRKLANLGKANSNAVRVVDANQNCFEILTGSP